MAWLTTPINECQFDDEVELTLMVMVVVVVMEILMVMVMLVVGCPNVGGRFSEGTCGNGL